MDIGYIRVSSVGQNTERQLQDVKLDKVFEEKVSASSIDRPKLKEAREYCREGDTLHIHSLDRVCRSGAGDAVALVEEMTKKGVSIVFVKDGIRFDGTMTATQKGLLSILASVAQMERELIAERRREGQANARAKGVQFGRPKAPTVSIKAIAELQFKGMKVTKIAKELEVHRSTIYRTIEQNKAEIEAAIDELKNQGLQMDGEDI